jgi:hypothetical protein
VNDTPPEAELLAQLLAERLTSGEAASLRVTGHSMTPSIRAGDLITLEPLRGLRPRSGDVLAIALPEGRLLVHRLVGWRRGRLVTRGDVAPAADAPAPLAAILGRVTRIEREGRPVRLGLGWERAPLAWLSRAGLLRLAARIRRRRA